MPTTFLAPRWRGEKKRCSHCERACRRCVPGQAGCTRTAGLGQSGCTAGKHAVPLGIWDTGQAHQSMRGEVCRSRCSERPFDLEASRADGVPTIPRAVLHSPFRNRGIRAGHIFCPSCWLPSLLMLVYSKGQCVSLRSRRPILANYLPIGIAFISISLPGSWRYDSAGSGRDKRRLHEQGEGCGVYGVARWI